MIFIFSFKVPNLSVVVDVNRFIILYQNNKTNTLNHVKQRFNIHQILGFKLENKAVKIYTTFECLFLISFHLVEHLFFLLGLLDR